MPTPYGDNAKAAQYVEYYGSRRMLEESTNRLYHGGIASKQAAVARAEQEACPSPPTVRRSKSEIDAYLRARVEGELLRRQQHRAALQQELYPQVEGPTRHLSPKSFERHMRRVYNDPLRRRALREREIERIFGTSPPQKEKAHATPKHGDAGEGGDGEKAKAPWRPASAHIPREDGREYLVSQYAYYADPKKFSEVYIESSKKGGRGDGKKRGPNYDRLLQLARPLSVTPRQVVEEEDVNAPPPFHVDRKIRYHDEI